MSGTFFEATAAGPSPGGGRVDPPAATRAGRGPGGGSSQKVTYADGRGTVPCRRWCGRQLSGRFNGPRGRRGDGGHQAAAVAKVRPRPTAHSNALAPPDQRPLSIAVGWWWCARVAASGGGAGTRPAPGCVVGAPFAVLKAALWPAVAALCRSVGLQRSGGHLRGVVRLNPQRPRFGGEGPARGPSNKSPVSIDLAADPVAGGGQGCLAGGVAALEVADVVRLRQPEARTAATFP